MSKGNILNDTRVDVATNCGTAKIGSRYTKSWEGADGRSRENNYSCRIAYQNYPLIKWSNKPAGPFTNTGSVTSCFGGVSFPNVTAAQISASQTRALNGVLQKWKGHDFNAAVFLGELPEAAAMVADSTLTVLKAFYQVRKGRFSKAVKILRDAHKQRGSNFRIDKSSSSAWLSLRYGWIPLISDGYNAVDAWNTLRQSKPVPFLKMKSRNTITFTPNPGNLKLGTAWKTYSTQTILKTDVPSNAFNSLGFGNPALLAWELLPLSFVLDWAIDIGSYLELAFELPSSRNTKYITTVFQRFNTRGPATYPGYYIHQSDAYVSWTIAVDRTVTSSASVPPPTFRNPFNGTLTRIGDMIALATQFKR